MKKEYVVSNAPQKDLFHELDDKGSLIKVLSKPGILRGSSVLDLFLKKQQITMSMEHAFMFTGY